MKKIRIFLVNLAKKNKTLRIFFRNILNLKNKLKYSYYKTKYKMDDKTILFEAFGGRNYTCSPKAIYEKMLTMKEFKDYYEDTSEQAQTNQYTNIFEGKNVLVIHAESIQQNLFDLEFNGQ